MSRYTVWSVGRDGNVFAHWLSDEPAEALSLFRRVQEEYVGTRRTFGITDNESPESGDVSDKLAQEVSE